MRRTLAWYAVRCCCQPQKIFGFIPLEAGSRTYQIVNRYGETHEIELRTSRTCSAPTFVESRDGYLEMVSDEIAIYSDDRPIEFWRTIPSFVEVR